MSFAITFGLTRACSGMWYQWSWPFGGAGLFGRAREAVAYTVAWLAMAVVSYSHSGFTREKGVMHTARRPAASREIVGQSPPRH